MFENIGLSFQGIWAHKMRSFLTMLGIIIGVAAIITIVSTIQGTNDQIKQNLIGAGNNAVKVSIFQGDYEYSIDEWNPVPAGFPALTQDIADEILNLDEVDAVAFYLSRYADSVIFRGLTTLSGGYIYGTDNNYFDVYGYVLKQGRTFVETDLTKYRGVAILDETAAKALFPDENPIEQTVEIKSAPYTVIGVVKQSVDAKPVINSVDDYYTYANTSSGAVFIPYSTWSVPFRFDEPQSVVVRATSADDMTTAGKQTADILNANSSPASSDISYKSQDLLEQAKNLQDLSNSTNQMLIWIASISLLVGGIGVMNIMLVSVTERTKEIGLKKALGARKSRILSQFLTEAAVLTSLGGFLGVGAGIGLAFAVSNIAEIPVSISIPAAAVAVIFSMLIGIIFGILPSVKAANLNPIEALRHE